MGLGATSFVGFEEYRQIELLRRQRETLEEIDHSVRDEEDQFLVIAEQLLRGDHEFIRGIAEYRKFDGPAVSERQQRFVWLSGNILSQVVLNSGSKNDPELLQRHLDRRSVLLKLFDKRAQRYEKTCAAGWRSGLARMVGECTEQR
jgi:hypothetical protein